MRDEWIREAMKDDNLVAELLLRLKEPGSHLSSRLNKGMTAAAEAPSVALPPPEWGMRHPRSKAAASKKEGHSTRRSPTTPLSWSGGGASPSDEYEECSLPSDPFPDVRSTGIGTNETVDTANKRSRRKKTFAELKEEESSLLKEQSYLKRELATLRVTLKEQRSLNHSLKRMKNDQDAESGAAKSSATLNQHDAVAPNSASSTCLSLIEEASSTLEGTPSIVPQQHIMQNVDGQDQDQEQAAFILPDLNVMPEDDFGSEARL